MSADGLLPGALVEATIEKGVFRGRGLARLAGRVVFVPRAHPGDRVRARITEVHAGWAEGALVEVLHPSPDRRASPCPYVPRCGGCAYQDYGPEAELRLKQAVMLESLARAGASWDGPVGVHASPEAGWRMRASLHFVSGEAGLRLGLREEGSRRVVDLEACLQLSPGMNRAARALHAGLAARPALAARVHGLELLESPDERALVATLETALGRHEAVALGAMAAGVPGLTGFGVRTRAGSLEWLAGTPFVEASVLGQSLRVHASSFFQANRFLLEPLARTVLELVPAGDSRILDLYAGVGLFALPLAARDGCETVAVEQSRLAAQDARFAARACGTAPAQRARRAGGTGSRRAAAGRRRADRARPAPDRRRARSGRGARGAAPRGGRVRLVRPADARP